MAIEKTLKVNLEEVSKELGVSLSDLKKFLSNPSSETIISQVESRLVLPILDEYLKNLINVVQINKKSPETLITYTNFINRLRLYIVDTCPDLSINDLNEITLNKVIRYNSEQDKAYSINTLNKYTAIVKSIMTFAYRSNYTQKDLGHKFKIENGTLLPRYIQDVDLQNILEAVKKFPKPIRCRAIIIFLLLTGCRVSEISNIKVKDFNVNENIIFIKNGKGKKDRNIPMFNELKIEILEYLRNSGMEKWDSTCEGFLFARDEGLDRSRKFPIRTIEYLVERIRSRVPNLNQITVHTFRHTFAVKCLKAGISLPVLSLILGHSEPKTTMIYTQLYNEDLKEELTKFPFPFENLLNQVITPNRSPQ